MRRERREEEDGDGQEGRGVMWCDKEEEVKNSTSLLFYCALF